MRQEFHGDGLSGGERKLLYSDWSMVNASVWLPSLSELVGTTGTQDTYTGGYFSAMQGMNTSNNYYTDLQGGNQFAYFKQYNTSGGGEKLWSCGGKEIYWLRSPHCGSSQSVWSPKDKSTMNSGNNPATASHAVHPAAE